MIYLDASGLELARVAAAWDASVLARGELLVDGSARRLD